MLVPAFITDCTLTLLLHPQSWSAVRSITPGESRILIELAAFGHQFHEAWMPFFCREERRPTSVEERGSGICWCSGVQLQHIHISDCIGKHNAVKQVAQEILEGIKDAAAGMRVRKAAGSEWWMLSFLMYLGRSVVVVVRIIPRERTESEARRSKWSM